MRRILTRLRARLSPRVSPPPPSQSSSGDRSPAVSNARDVAINYYHVTNHYHVHASGSCDGDTPRAPCQLPDSPPGGRLLGRSPLLCDLCDRLRRRENTAVVGPAGFGKSALAGEAVRTVIGGDDLSLQASPFPDGVVLLDIYRAKGRATDIWNALAEALIGGAHPELPAHQRAECACRGRRILIIVEGAEEANGIDERCRLKELLSVCDAMNRHLILTRDSTQVCPAQAVRITQELDAAASSELFGRIAGGSIDSEIREAILARLQGHPLALTWAASLLARGDVSPQQLLGEWSRSVLPGLSDPIEARHTLKWLFERSVLSLSALERATLEAAGLLAHAEFPLEALEAALDTPTEARAALMRLVQSGLLRRSAQRDDHWHFTHILGYQFARREVGATPELQARLASWLQARLAHLLERGDYLTLPSAVLHASALLLTDENQSLWELAQFCLRNAVNRTIMAGQLSLVVQELQVVGRWMDRLPRLESQKPFWQRVRSILLERFGDAQWDQGDLGTALRSYTQSHDIRLQLISSDPNNTQWQRDLSISHDNLGDVQRALGDLGAALHAYLDEKDISEKLVRSDSRNSTWQRDLSVSYNNLGKIHFAQGDLPAALRSYSESCEIRLILARADKNREQLQWDLSVSYDNLGDIHWAQGDLAAALRNYSDSCNIRRKLASAYPLDALMQRGLSVSYNNLGDVLRAMGDVRAALSSYLDAKNILESVARSDQNSMMWQRDLSLSYNKIGEVQRTQGDLAIALQDFRESCSVLVKLVCADPHNVHWQRDLGASYGNIGDIQRDFGDLETALSSYTTSKEIAERLAFLDPRNALWQSDLGISYQNLGDLLRELGDLEAAQYFYITGKDIAEKLVRQTPDNAQWQYNLSICYSSLGDLLQDQEDFEAALRNCTDSTGILETLIQVDPRNTLWLRALSVGYNRRGNVQWAQGDLEAALRSFRDSCRIRLSLARKDADNVLWQRDLLYVLTKLSVLLEQSGFPEDALQPAADGLAISERLSRLHPDNALWLQDVRIGRSRVTRLHNTITRRRCNGGGAACSPDLRLNSCALAEAYSIPP